MRTKIKKCLADTLSRIVTAYLMFFSTGLGICVYAQDGQMSIKQLNAIFYGNGTNINRSETECLKLLETNSAPSDKAMVYLAIANKYANNDLIYPAKTAEYCKLALEYPQGIVNICHLYSMWGGALESQYNTNLNNIEYYLKVRRTFIKPYLDALAIIATNRVPEKRQPLPSVGMYDYSGPKTNAIYQEMVKKHDKQVIEREEVDLENDLITYRDQITAEIARHYERKLDNLDELREMALQEFNNNTNAVEELMQRVEKIISQSSHP
jgi:hypothetical protein